MRTAPPVSVRCSGGAAWHALRAGLPALAAGALAAWVLGHAGWPVYPALAVVLRDLDYRVGLLDLDFYGPSAHVILGAGRRRWPPGWAR